MGTALITTNGKNILLYRGYTENGNLSSTLRLAPIQYQLGISQTTTPIVSTTALDLPIPIADGTANDDGSNTFTGSSGADNSTSNTTTYKEGAGQVDVTAQNLIANNSSASKIWTISNLASAGTVVTGTLRVGLWLYILDSAALAKFKSSGICLEVKLGSDTSNYYSKTWTAADLAVGWNWLNSGLTAVNALTETGTVSGSIDTFIITITTNNTTDTFIAGDVVYDLLRTWSEAHLLQAFVSGYPTFDYTNSQATVRLSLSSVQGNGFDISGVATFNADTTPLMDFVSQQTEESKSLTDEFAWVIKNRVL